MEFTTIPTINIIWMAIGAVIYITVPIVLAIVWKLKKREAITSILAGALTWLLFAIILEKPIQNVLIYPQRCPHHRPQTGWRHRGRSQIY